MQAEKEWANVRIDHLFSILETFAVPLAFLRQFTDMKRTSNSDVEILPEGMPHIVVVGHDAFFSEAWNEDRFDSVIAWHNGLVRAECVTHDRYLFRMQGLDTLDAETENFDYLNMVSPLRVHEYAWK